MAQKTNTQNSINSIDKQQRDAANKLLRKEQETMTNTNGTDNSDNRTITRPNYPNTTTEAPTPRFTPDLGHFIINDQNFYEYVGPIYEFQYRGGKFIIKIWDDQIKRYSMEYTTDLTKATHIRLFWTKGNYNKVKDFDLSDKDQLLKAMKYLAPYNGQWLSHSEWETITPSIKRLAEISKQIHLKTMYLGFFEYTNETTGHISVRFTILKPNVLTNQIIANDDFDF